MTRNLVRHAVRVSNAITGASLRNLIFARNYRKQRLFRALPGICLLGLLAWPAAAQQTTGPQQLLAAETATQFDQLLANIAAEEAEIVRLAQRQNESDGPLSEIFGTRVDRTTMRMFKDLLALARQVVRQRERGVDVATYEAAVTEDLRRIPAAINIAIGRVWSRVTFATEDLSPQDFVIKDQQLFAAVAEMDEILKIVVEYLGISGDFGLDASRELEFVRTSLIETAANRSVFLERALEEVAALRVSVATLPDNADLKDRYNAMERRVTESTRSLQRLLPLMNEVGIESRVYRSQLLSVTGEISTDVFDLGVVGKVFGDWGSAALDVVSDEGPKWLLRIFLVFLILFVFLQISKVAQRAVKHGLNSAGVRVSYLLKEMVVSSVRNLTMLIGILIAISQLGVSLAPLLAGLGIAGFIIGFALQDSLANFASGMLILLYRPFDVGDVVDSGGVRGRVSAMSLVNTTFLTLDNQKLVVPNNLIWSSVITNITAQRTRRIDLVFGISYGDDVEKAQAVLEDILAQDETVLDDPVPVVRVHELGESSVNFIVRPWVKTDDYWETYWAITKAVKLRFNKEGISIPFPQRDVHLFEQKPG
jgi:small conductance mechanosensitive channel